MAYALSFVPTCSSMGDEEITLIIESKEDAVAINRLLISNGFAVMIEEEQDDKWVELDPVE